MSGADALAVLGGAAATLSAGASIISARAASLGSRPWVTGDVVGAEGQDITVNLRNEGPGLAVDVRFRLPSLYGGMWSDSLGSLAAGQLRVEYMPAPENFNRGIVRTLPIETEFADLRGARWRLGKESHQPLLLRRSWVRKRGPWR
jgi:hypothetical protein